MSETQCTGGPGGPPLDEPFKPVAALEIEMLEMLVGKAMHRCIERHHGLQCTVGNFTEKY